MLPHHTVHSTGCSLVSNVHTIWGRGGGGNGRFGNCRTFFLGGGGLWCLDPSATLRSQNLSSKKVTTSTRIYTSHTYIEGIEARENLVVLWGVTLEAKYMSAGPVRCFIFCSISIFLPACLVTGRRPQWTASAAGNVLHHTYPLEYQIFSSQPRQRLCWASSLRI
jgi:hypothetical protein